jgi:thioredoxin reductase
LFTRGFEFRGSASAGVIAADLASSPPHAVILGEDASKFAENVTIYTNGDQNLAKEISKILHQRGEKNVPVDSRKITRIERVTATDSVKLHFEQGDERTESFLVHQPATKVSEVFVSQLGLETNPRGDIVTKMPFYQTNVSGVFAAGDSASPFKMIPNAMFQGSNAGAGIARELPRRLTGNKVNRLQNGQLATWLQSLK